MFEQVEEQVQSLVEWLRLGIEALGALVIAAGVVVVVAALARRALSRQGGSFTPIRLSFALPDAGPGAAAGRRHPVDLGGADLGPDRQAGGDRCDPDGA